MRGGEDGGRGGSPGGEDGKGGRGPGTAGCTWESWFLECVEGSNGEGVKKPELRKLGGGGGGGGGGGRL